MDSFKVSSSRSLSDHAPFLPAHTYIFTARASISNPEAIFFALSPLTLPQAALRPTSDASDLSSQSPLTSPCDFIVFPAA